MQAVLGACILWALFSTGASLTCSLCLNLTGPCLESDPQVCEPDEDSCYDTVNNVTILGKFYVNLKGCIPSSECVPGTYSSTTEGNGVSQTVVTCCNTDYCNNATSSLPSASNVLPNGLACAACVAMGTEVCQQEELILCTGEETMCIVIAGSFDLSGTTFPLQSEGILKGCTTPNTCQAVRESVNEANNDNILYNVTRIECTYGIRAAKNAINSTLPSSAPLPGR